MEEPGQESNRRRGDSQVRNDDRMGMFAEMLTHLANVLSTPSSANLLMLFAMLIMIGSTTYLSHQRALEVAVFLKNIEANRHDEMSKLKELVAQCQIEARLGSR